MAEAKGIYQKQAYRPPLLATGRQRKSSAPAAVQANRFGRGHATEGCAAPSQYISTSRFSRAAGGIPSGTSRAKAVSAPGVSLW